MSHKTALAGMGSGDVNLREAARSWLRASGMLGPDAPQLPVRAEVEGDHYRVVIPLLGVRTPAVEPAVSAAVRKLPDGRWGIDDVHFPGKFAFATIPIRPDTGPGTATVAIGDRHARATRSR